MSLISIDTEKCNKDGICAAECPVKIIMMQDDIPTPVDGAEDLCIGCGHCVSVCPKSALTHKDLSPEQCLPVNRNMILNPEQAEHFLRYRRSIRTYKEKQVDDDVLKRIIKIASHAPTGHNLQNVKWQVIYNSDEVKRLSGLVIDWMRILIEEHPQLAKSMHADIVVAGWDFGMDTVSRGAPHLVLVNGRADDILAANSCTIAMAHLELALQPFGLGGCWNGFFNAAARAYEPLKEALGHNADGLLNHGAMMVGVPKYKYHRMPPRNEPVISWI